MTEDARKITLQEYYSQAVALETASTLRTLKALSDTNAEKPTASLATPDKSR